MRLYTIGFAGKRAERFFDLLRDHGVRRLIDIRLKPGGQLAGFAKGDDLPYFLQRLADGCDYLRLPALAPAPHMLKDYRADGDWERYAARFEQLMDERGVPEALGRSLFEAQPCCLLCSEPTPEHCHRRLAAERLARAWPAVEIIHL